jgi:hypothetical protein
MKIRITAVFAILAMLFLAIPTMAEAPKEGISGVIGVANLQLKKYSSTHNTHGDDGFLRDANVPGSAGKTEIGGRLNFFELAAVYHYPVSEKFVASVSWGLLAGLTRDRHQNDNDTRGEAQGSFVYSQAKWGGYAALGLTYYLKDLYLGVEARETAVMFESGWDRWGSDESAHDSWVWTPSVGPKVGYSFGFMNLELGSQFSSEGLSFNLQANFWVKE